MFEFFKKQKAEEDVNAGGSLEGNIAEPQEGEAVWSKTMDEMKAHEAAVLEEEEKTGMVVEEMDGSSLELVNEGQESQVIEEGVKAEYAIDDPAEKKGWDNDEILVADDRREINQEEKRGEAA